MLVSTFSPSCCTSPQRPIQSTAVDWSHNRPLEKPPSYSLVTMRYLMQEKIFAIGNDFWVQDDQGNRPFVVDGKALRERFDLKDPDGHVLVRIHKKHLAIRESLKIEDGDGQTLATVRAAWFSPIKHRYEVELADGSKWEAVGNFTDKDWALTDQGGRVVGRISKQWFAIRDSYGIEVAPGANDPLIIGIAVCIDRIHEDKAAKEQR